MKLLQDILQKIEEVSLLKESLDKLQQQVSSHVCTIVTPTNVEDPTTQVLQWAIELKMVEHDTKKVQRELETACQLLNLSEDQTRTEKENAKK